MPFVSEAAKRRFFVVACAAILLLAASLRMIGARGDLSFDEIWSLHLLTSITSADQIFWKINHDNNHFLNSLWLYAVGPDASSMTQRALSILFGIATVPVSGYWARSSGRRGILLTMFLFAFALPAVSYGSEARGYAGLILFTIVSACLVETALAGRPRPWLLALSNLFGLASHLTMAFTMLTLAAWVFWEVFCRTTSPKRALGFTVRLFLPSVLLCLPLIACVLPPLIEHRFTIGIVSHAGAVAFLSWGALLRYALRAGTLMAPPFYLMAAAWAVWATWRYQVTPGRAKFYLLAIVLYPVSLILSGVPNLDQPRYYLLSGIGLMLLLCQMAVHPWRDWQAHGVVLVLVLLVAWGEGTFTWRFLHEQRGHYSAAVRVMTAEGATTYGTDDEMRNPMIVDFYARRLAVKATNIPRDQWCRSPPDWLLTFTFGQTAPMPEKIYMTPGCTETFDRPLVFGYFGMNGLQWNLYRRKSYP